MKCKIKYEQKTKIIPLKEVLKNSLILGGVLLSLTYSSYASVTDITNKSLSTNLVEFNDGRTTDATKTKDEGSVVVGATNVFSNDNSDVNSKIVKYDKDGNQLWVKSFGGSGYDSFSSVIETQDGGYIAVGYSDSTDAGFNNKGSNDAIIAKYDKDGNQLWVKSFGGSSDDYFGSVIKTQDGGCIVRGYSRSTNAGFVNKGGKDVIVIKYDKEGNQLWIKNFGGNGDDYFSSVTKTQDGGYIAVGYSDSTDGGFINKGRTDAIIVKYDKEGNQLWIKNFGGSDDDYFSSVTKTQDGGYIAVGYSDSTDTEFVNEGWIDAIVVKYDKEGNQLWVKSFGGSSDDRFSSVIKTQDGGFITVGYSISFGSELRFVNSNVTIIKHDKDGNQQWIKYFNKDDQDVPESIVDTTDDELVILVLSVISDENPSPGMTISSSTIVRYNENYEEIFDKIENVETTNDSNDLKNTRELVNNIPEGVFKEHFQNRLNNLNVNEVLERKTASSNVDIYIKSENVLMMSLDTNSITFEDFSGVEDMEKTNAVNITINSSLPYSLNAYLPAEIQNSDKSNTMDKQILNIKENSEVDYQTFTNTTDKIVLKDNNPAGNNLTHGIDIKLKGGIAHEKDIYKTTIKFEAQQK